MSWTKVTNPSTSSFVKVTNPSYKTTITQVGGSPIGLLMALTYATTTSVPIDPWTKRTNPSSNSWTKVTNPS